MPDLSALSTLDDEQLLAAYVVLSERAHQITLAQERIKARWQMRMLGHDLDGAVDGEKHRAWGDEASQAVVDAVAAAPAKADEIREAKQRRAATIAMLLVEVPGTIMFDKTPGVIPENLAAHAAERLDALEDLTNADAVYAAIEGFIRPHSVA